MVLCIRTSTTGNEPLAAELKSRGFELFGVSETDGLSGLPTEPGPAAIIADTEYTADAARLRDKLKGRAEHLLPLLVISDDTALQVRLSAMRHGADAFFPPPLDPVGIAVRLAELVGTTHAQSAYKVMVVDDDPTQADFAAAILRKAGIEVTTVTESLRILETLRTFRPELILMDVYMPEASGVELTTIIREQKDLMDIPIVYLSAEHDPDKQLDALSVGGEDFLTKPIRPKHLIATVRNRIDRSRQLRDRRDPRKRTDGDPALVRKHILELLEHMHKAPGGDGLATGLFYLELDSPVLLLEKINLDGIDQMMSQILDIAKEAIKTGDRVARFGDFCLVLIVRRDFESELIDLARTLKAQLDTHRFKVAHSHMDTTVSIGLRMLEQKDQDASKLINEAIKACHQARAQGENDVLVHRDAKRAEQAAVRHLNQDLLKRVTDTDNLSVVYQPIVPLHQEHEALYQCLLRLRSGSGELLSAGEFLPEVEQTGKILKLDRWMIIKALVTLHKMSHSGLGLFVSQSSTSLKDLQRIDWLGKKLGKAHIEAKNLILEFPFPDIALDLDLAQSYLEKLRGLGIGISLNCVRELDALLSDLPQLSASYIKITENQIRNYPDTWQDLVKSAHRSGASLIVSRIEHPELLGQLWAQEVDYIQGNFIQPPASELDYDFTGAVLG